MTVLSDVAIWRWMVETMAEDCRRASFWAAAACGTATVTYWQAQALREKSEALRRQSRALRAESARQRREAAQLRRGAAGQE